MTSIYQYKDLLTYNLQDLKILNEPLLDGKYTVKSFEIYRKKLVTYIRTLSDTQKCSFAFLGVLGIV
jgi:hypothetical protein